MAYMDTLDKTPENFMVAVRQLTWDKGVQMMCDAGKAILSYQARVIAEHVKHIKFHTVHGYKFATVNATTLPSEIGQAILEAYPEVQVAHMYNQREDLKMVVNSLRSRPESAGGVDVSHIAKVFGGGGHYSAAGYETGLYP
jgi:nanoRNase/pAp phosphatase (c-di-AMP/oligoRNAs hydrolase)